MMKKRTTLWVAPEVVKDLKRIGVERDLPIGDVIEGLIEFSKSDRHVKDELFRERFRALLDTALSNTGENYGWRMDPAPKPQHVGMGAGGDDTEE